MIVYLGLGTNLGDREANLRAALAHLARILDIEAVSSVYHSEPVGYREQPDYWNLVARARTTLEPEGLLGELQRAEWQLGRQPSFPNAPRVIDIDLLLYDDRQLATPALELPHPRMLERAFVLRPLLELDPDARHPRTGERLRDALARGSFEATERLFDGSVLLDPARRVP
ncbi:MAG: 2-amino-4-hydroxy-6-hydroxymethyldihydropteridine diphosphokinase [Gemmatimonadetes bacterium]|nr:2-amino-4-hydroxy-6-hydroxymethyldihydropteridine diphosphokinase [Gemmatimonadota bacterium]